MVTLRQKVIEYIQRSIQSGKIRPNELIKESEICNRLSISRTPVREALIELVKDGILVRKPNKGYIIQDSEKNFKLNIYDIIGALDGLAASLAVHKLTDEDFLKMEEILANIEVAIKFRNYAHYHELQEKFHQVYIQKCDNPPLIDLLKETKTRILRYAYYHEDADKLFAVTQKVNAQHYIILDLLRQKKLDELRDYIQDQHWQTLYYDMI